MVRQAMPSLSDEIEEFIKRLTEQAGGRLEIQRQRLAVRFGCAPSQINYVLETRFTVDHGYAIESRRGGSGFLRIIKLSLSDPAQILEYLWDRIGETMPQREAEAIVTRLADEGCINEREAALIRAAVDSQTLQVAWPDLDRIRADLLRKMLVAVLTCGESKPRRAGE